MTDTLITRGTLELPPLTVPSLKETLTKFVYFSKVLLDKGDQEEAIREAQSFLTSETAQKLQQLLEERAKLLPNWLTPWWNEYAYLRYRASLPIYSSVGVSCGRILEQGLDESIKFAAKTIRVLTQFIINAKKNTIKTEFYGKRPLEMRHHHRFFGSTRIPKKDCDEYHVIEDYEQLEGHIVVVRRGNTFIMPVWDVKRALLSEGQLIKEINNIVRQSEKFNKEPINLCSSDNRDDWAVVYERLKSRYPNSIKLYENALFVVALDEIVTPKKGQKLEDANLLNAFHGTSSSTNAINRWQDKFHLLFDPQGFYGVVYEHTPADGAPLATVIVSVWEQVFNEREKQIDGEDASNIYSTFTQKLEFQLLDEDRKAIRETAKRLDKVISTVDAKYFAFEEFGKNVPKQAGISPDSFIQIALQLAFYRLHRRHGNAYESASLRMFAEGRTETIRLPNMESSDFVTNFVRNKEMIGSEELCKQLYAACKAHKLYSDMCAGGKGMDRHLFGLRITALTNHIPIPTFFQSKGYQRLTSFDLSTSQVPMRTRPRMIYAPLCPNGYGALYNPAEEVIDIGISVFVESKESDLDGFQESLFRSLRDMRGILENNGKINRSNI